MRRAIEGNHPYLSVPSSQAAAVAKSDFMAQLLLISGDRMKNFLMVILVLGAIGYYFDISPTDFLPSVPNSPQPRGERHTSAVAVKDVTAPPVAAPTATPDNGSLANRWKP